MDKTNASNLLRIGDLARLCAKTHRALHLYEEMGLLVPAYRTQGGFRLYDASAVERVRWISCLQEANWSLPQIRQFIAIVEKQPLGRQSMEQVRAMLQDKLIALRAQQERLAQLEKELLAGLAYADGCHGCQADHPLQGCQPCSVHGTSDQKPLLIAGIHHGA